MGGQQQQQQLQPLHRAAAAARACAARQQQRPCVRAWRRCSARACLGHAAASVVAKQALASAPLASSFAAAPSASQSCVPARLPDNPPPCPCAARCSGCLQQGAARLVTRRHTAEQQLQEHRQRHTSRSSTMLEEALPIAIGVGAALLPAMAFGGLAGARAFMFLGAGALPSCIGGVVHVCMTRRSVSGTKTASAALTVLPLAPLWRARLPCVLLGCVAPSALLLLRMPCCACCAVL